MARGETVVNTPGIPASLEALDQHAQEMHNYLNSSDDLEKDMHDDLSIEKMISASILGPIEAMLRGEGYNVVELRDLYEYRAVEVISVAESLTHVRERAVKVSKGLTDVAQKAYYAGTDRWHDYSEHVAKTAKKSEKKRKEHELKPGDSLSTKTKKSLTRSAMWLHEKAVTTAPKALAATIAGVAVLTLGHNLFDLDGKKPQETTISAEYALAANESILVAGGAGQGEGTVIVQEFQAKGYVDGSDTVQPSPYSSEIGPFVGTQRMDVSAQQGADVMFRQYKELSGHGKNVRLMGFSEGTRVTYDTLWMIYRDNGNTWPQNVTVTMVGGPYQEGGLFDHPIVNGVSPFVNAAGIPTNKELPPGANVEFVYYEGDIYANGGNQLTSTLIFDMMMVGGGAHSVPDVNRTQPEYVFTDSEGRVHKVYSSDQVYINAIQSVLGIRVHNTQATIEAIDAFFPHAVRPGQELHPDVRRGLMASAVAIDDQIEHDLGLPTGSVHFMETMVDAMPEQWKDLGQTGLEGFNKISDTAGKMMSGEIDPFTGMQIISGEMTSILGSLQRALPNPDAGYTPVRDMAAGTIAGEFQSYTGIDIRPVLEKVKAAVLQKRADGQATNRQNNPLSSAQEVNTRISQRLESALERLREQHSEPVITPTQNTIDEQQTLAPQVADVPAGIAPVAAPSRASEPPSISERPNTQPAGPVNVPQQFIPSPPEEIPSSAAPRVIISPPAPRPAPAPAPAPAPVIHAPAPPRAPAAPQPPRPIIQLPRPAAAVERISPPAPAPAPIVPAPAPRRTPTPPAPAPAPAPVIHAPAPTRAPERIAPTGVNRAPAPIDKPESAPKSRKGSRSSSNE